MRRLPPSSETIPKASCLAPTWDREVSRGKVLSRLEKCGHRHNIAPGDKLITWVKLDLVVEYVVHTSINGWYPVAHPPRGSTTAGNSYPQAKAPYSRERIASSAKVALENAQSLIRMIDDDTRDIHLPAEAVILSSLMANTVESRLIESLRADAAKRNAKNKASPSRDYHKMFTKMRKFVIDSGAALHVINDNYMSEAERKFMHNLRKPIELWTANGKTSAVKGAQFDFPSLDGAQVRAVVMSESPCLLSLGRLCMVNGISFHWPAYQNPFLVNADGTRIDLFVSNFTPYLPDEGIVSSYTYSPEEIALKQAKEALQCKLGGSVSDWNLQGIDKDLSPGPDPQNPKLTKTVVEAERNEAKDSSPVAELDEVRKPQLSYNALSLLRNQARQMRLLSAPNNGNMPTRIPRPDSSASAAVHNGRTSASPAAVTSDFVSSAPSAHHADSTCTAVASAPTTVLCPVDTRVSTHYGSEFMASASHSLPDSPSATLRTDCGSLPPMPSGRFSATHALTVASSPRLEPRSDDPPSNHPSHCQSSDLSAAPTSRCSDPAVAVAVVSPASATNRLSTYSGSGGTRSPRHFCAVDAASDALTAPQQPFLPTSSSCRAPTMIGLDRDAACGTPTAPHPVLPSMVCGPATCSSFSSSDAGCNDLAPFSLTPALLVAILPSPGNP